MNESSPTPTPRAALREQVASESTISTETATATKGAIAMERTRDERLQALRDELARHVVAGRIQVWFEENGSQSPTEQQFREWCEDAFRLTAIFPAVAREWEGKE